MIAITALLPIFGYAAIFYIFFKRTVSASIFFSITSLITILFLFGMMGFLKSGTYILFYGGICFLLFLSIWFKDKLFEAVQSVPFIIFTIINIIYCYLMQDAKLFFWDEYSHWGAFIKEMYYFHHFYDASSVAAHVNYPPGISIWDYFIVLPTGFGEGKLYFAYFLILFSSTLMMYEKLSFKQVHWIVLVFSIQMVVFAGFGHWFSSIYVDHVIGAMFVGLLLTYLVDHFDGKQFILFVFPLTAIVLIKEIGLYFGFASIGLILILQISRFKLESGNSLLSSIKEQKRVFVILSIVAPIINQEADIVIGDRHSNGTYKDENTRPLHNFGNNLVKNLINKLFNSNLKDIMSGYRAFNKKFVKNMPVISEGFEIETEMTLHTLDKKFLLKEVPIEYRDRPEGSFSKLNTFSDGTRVLKTIFWVFKDYKPLAFFTILSIFFFVLSLIVGIPVITEFIDTSFITKIPSAILSVGLMLVSILFLFSGFILDTIVKQHREHYELNLIRWIESYK